MSFSDLLSSGLVEDVVVDEGLKGMVVVVTGVPKPLTSIENRPEVTGAPVVGLTAKPQETPVSKSIIIERCRL